MSRQLRGCSGVCTAIGSLLSGVLIAACQIDSRDVGVVEADVLEPGELEPGAAASSAVTGGGQPVPSASGATTDRGGPGLPPSILETDGPVDFGSVAQDTTATRNVTVISSADELTTSVSSQLAGQNASSFSILGNGCLAGLEAQGSCLVTLAFTPPTTGAHVATLRLDAEGGGTREVDLSGSGVAPSPLGPAQIVAEPNAILLAPVLVGQSASARVTVTNRGNAPTGNIAVNLARPLSAFRVNPSTCSRPLAPGESCVFEAFFAPTLGGAQGTAVTVSGAPGGTIEVPLDGIATEAAALAITPNDGAQFGGVAIGSSATLAFTLGNDGDVSAGTLSDISFNTPFYALAPAATGECELGATTLYSGVSCIFRVTFSPTASGSLTATMVATTSLGVTTNRLVTGVGQLPAALVSNAVSLAFQEPVNTVAQGSEFVIWRVANDGGGPTEPLLFSNSNPEEFRVAQHSCVGSLAPGATCEVPLQLAPNFIGPRQATLTVTAGPQSVSVLVQGVGE